MKYTIKTSEIETYNDSTTFSFPKYTSQLINLANQNAQGTRPVVVGQMSELFPEFLLSAETINIENWVSWYSERYPDAVAKATERIWEQMQNLQSAITVIDRELIQKWVEDLIICKTLSLANNKMFNPFLN